MNSPLTFKDIFKSSFLDRMVSDFSLTDIALGLGVAFLVGMFIYAVYRRTFAGVLYSQGFNTGLVVLPMITALLILAVTSNVVLSLGMVGALSIVRFRAAIKDPLDIAYLFWSIGGGIVCGAGLFPLAIIGSLAIGLALVAFQNRRAYDNPYLLVVNCIDEEGEGQVTALLGQKVKRYVVKSKSVTAESGVELTLELRLRDMQTEFVNELGRISGVRNATLISYNGDYAA